MTIRLGAWMMLGTWMAMAGCVLGKSSLGETSPGDDDDGEASGGESSGTDDGETDPGVTSMDPGPTDGGGGPGQHAACSAPAPAPLPALPAINMLPGGTPAFTAWEPLTSDCDALVGVVSICEGGCPEQQCIPEDKGVCAEYDIDIWCDGEGEATGFGDGCFICLSAEQHARGCCAVPESFDCRTWPYAGTSGPDMICATHEDCEPGLVCASPNAMPTGYGVCRCPESLGTDVDLSGCFG